MKMTLEWFIIFIIPLEKNNGTVMLSDSNTIVLWEVNNHF